MRLSGRWRCETAVGAAAASVAMAAALGGCGVRSLTADDAGGGTGGAAGAGVIVEPPNPLISDFDEPGLAVIVHYGSRNGTWYTYNDGSVTCTQKPASGGAIFTDVPPGTPPMDVGGRALHAFWNECTTWGAGVGADIHVPSSPDGGMYVGPRVPYDLSAYSGLTFWALATRGTDVQLRFKMVMSASTLIADGGSCDENVVGIGKCGDEWGQVFQLSDGAWYPVKINFTSPSFHQEGWGAAFPWEPRDVVGIQVQSVDAGQNYDFWIDDMYLLP